jgi:hypothetical protein
MKLEASIEQHLATMVKREQIPWTQLDGLLEKIRTAVEVADKLDRSEKLSAVAYNLDKACKILNIFVCKAEHSDALQLSGDVWRWTPFAINDEPFMVCGKSRKLTHSP